MRVMDVKEIIVDVEIYAWKKKENQMKKGSKKKNNKIGTARKVKENGDAIRGYLRYLRNKQDLIIEMANNRKCR